MTLISAILLRGLVGLAFLISSELRGEPPEREFPGLKHQRSQVMRCPLRPLSPPRPPFGSRQKSCEHFAQSTLKRSSKTRFLRWKHHSLVPTTHLSPSLPDGLC